MHIIDVSLVSGCGLADLEILCVCIVHVLVYMYEIMSLCDIGNQ